MESDELVPVFSTNLPALAAMVVNELHADGIAATVDNSNQGGFAGILEVRVFVKASDEARADKVLHHHGRKREKTKDAE